MQTERRGLAMSQEQEREGRQRGEAVSHIAGNMPGLFVFLRRSSVANGMWVKVHAITSGICSSQPLGNSRLEPFLKVRSVLLHHEVSLHIASQWQNLSLTQKSCDGDVNACWCLSNRPGLMLQRDDRAKMQHQNQLY